MKLNPRHPTNQRSTQNYIEIYQHNRITITLHSMASSLENKKKTITMGVFFGRGGVWRKGCMLQWIKGRLQAGDMIIFSVVIK